MKRSDETISDRGSVRAVRSCSAGDVGADNDRAGFLLMLIAPLVLSGALLSVAEVNAAPGAGLVGIRPIDTGSCPRGQQDAERGNGHGAALNPPGGKTDRAENSIPSGGDYVLGSTDVIEIHIEDAPELSKKFTVGSDGTIAMVYLKAVRVGGKTCREVEKEIAAGLRGRYLRDPHVTVTVLQSNSRSYYVQGAVHSPGMYVVAGNPTLMKLITIAGGLADNHGSTAYIIREIRESRGNHGMGSDPSGQSGSEVSQASSAAGGDKPKYDLLKTNINSLFLGDFSQDMAIQPGDIINIPQTDLFFVAGAVRKPGPFPLKDGTTLQQAISMAEGTTFKAASGDTIIFRDDPRGKRIEIKVDVGAVMRGKRDDIPILANDIIMVPDSRTRSALQIILQGFGTSALRVPVP